MKVYIVTATQGEYSDRSEWPVYGYRDELLAQQHVEHATRVHAELSQTIRRRDDEEADFDTYTAAEKLGAENVWDPGISISTWDDRTYYVCQVDVLDALPASGIVSPEGIETAPAGSTPKAPEPGPEGEAPHD